ncbi:hypothetical protein GUITHDRAFT_153114 [Guillardia theta CCMP2712]|uniref:RapZ C-terminal domain-containing protein n=1 Tax=Guillardia theta (strain CCMP2712) TaxID=905079 RepID=L1J5Z6_GUITC|nr:hypothetical protein GUITHDRAFT_153114 [Guillardia theta CCMP2712]EKX43958.1 hypothetical protein GUITHDRAFT_153114 [Guillardia theta CCMP2712]|eukprot:XP_005830938.1 hypothetical protein GUITHDRAFT_153114 [Guillardia theta CCMP2712]
MNKTVSKCSYEDTDYNSASKKRKFSCHQEVIVSSFSFKTGAPNADLVVDVRFLPDPRTLENEAPDIDGTHSQVEEFIRARSSFDSFFTQLTENVASVVGDLKDRGSERVELAIGCTAGRHRSVFVAERLARWLRENVGADKVRVLHREISPRSHQELMEDLEPFEDQCLITPTVCRVGPMLKCTYCPDTNNMNIQEVKGLQCPLALRNVSSILGTGLESIKALREKRRLGSFQSSRSEILCGEWSRSADHCGS